MTNVLAFDIVTFFGADIFLGKSHQSIVFCTAIRS